MLVNVIQLGNCLLNGTGQGGGGTRIPNQGQLGVVRLEAEKRKVTTPILMAEVVVNVPKQTLDGSPGVQV